MCIRDRAIPDNPNSATDRLILVSHGASSCRMKLHSNQEFIKLFIYLLHSNKCWLKFIDFMALFKIVKIKADKNLIYMAVDLGKVSK